MVTTQSAVSGGKAWSPTTACGAWVWWLI